MGFENVRALANYAGGFHLSAASFLFSLMNFFSISALRFHFMLKSDETEDAIMSPVWDRLIISKKD